MDQRIGRPPTQSGSEAGGAARDSNLRTKESIRVEEESVLAQRVSELPSRFATGHLGLDRAGQDGRQIIERRQPPLT